MKRNRPHCCAFFKQKSITKIDKSTTTCIWAKIQAVIFA